MGEDDRCMNRRSSTPLVALAALIFAAVLGGALYGALSEPDAYDPLTPEGVVQGYLAAIFDDDELVAVGFMTDDLAENCRNGSTSTYRSEGARVFLEDSEIDSDDATVDIEIRHSGNGLDEWTESQTIWLERGGGTWRISQPPWPYWDCEGELR